MRRLSTRVLLIALAFAAAGAVAPAGAAACGGSPRDAVVRYYAAVNQRQFATGWSCLRTATRASFGGYTHWRTGYRNTVYTHVLSAVTTDQGAGLGHVRFLLATCTRSNGARVRERISGTWFTQNGSAGWRIGSPHARVVERSRAASCTGRAATTASCAPVVNPYKGTRYDGVDLSRIRATGVSCSEARRVARGAHGKALGLTPPPSGIRRFNWNGWRVTGDLRGPTDSYTATNGTRRVRWRF